MADLLALLIEVTSVPASGRQLKKPVQIKRPKDTTAKPERPATTEEVDASFKRGIGVLAASAKGVTRG